MLLQTSKRDATNGSLVQGRPQRCRTARVDAASRAGAVAAFRGAGEMLRSAAWAFVRQHRGITGYRRIADAAMNLVDANLLLYAYDTSAVRLVVCDGSRIRSNSTTPRIFAEPFSIEEACDIVNDWLRLQSVVLLEPTRRHWQLFSDVALRSQARGPLVPDADLAATALEHGATLCTHDRFYAL